MEQNFFNKLDEALINTSRLENLSNKKDCKTIAGYYILNEIECFLFQIPSKERGLFINRVLSHVFDGLSYDLFEFIKYEHKERDIKIRELVVCSITDDGKYTDILSEKQSIYVEKEWENEKLFFVYLIRFIKDLNVIIDDYKIKFNEEQYPINKVKWDKVNYEPSYSQLIPIDILNKLIKNGMVKQPPLQWLKSKSLLAYFADTANDKLNLKHGQQRKIAPFEMIFNVNGLNSAINDYKKTGILPVGHEEIDKIFTPE